MNWAAEANAMSHKFLSVFRHRKKLMSDLYDRLDMHGLKPQRKKYKTHDGSEDKVVTFDFKQSLLSLLCDKTLMSDNNKLFSGNTPFYSIDTKSGSYSYLNSSDRYKQIQIYKPLHQNEVRIPLILYVDKANIDDKGTIIFEPHHAYYWLV